MSKRGPAVDEPLQIRAALGRHRWAAPTPFGPAGWRLTCLPEAGSVIVTRGPIDATFTEWVHASIAFADRDPSYAELAHLARAVFRDSWAYQVFAPPSDHVNLHPHALHLFGRYDGRNALPTFAPDGMI